MSQIKIPIYRRLVRKMVYLSAPILSDKIFLNLFYWACIGEKLNLSNPKSFCEKVQWLKLNDCRPEYTNMVDKNEAKRYVASVIGDKYIIPTLALVNNVEEIDLKELPNQFVIKWTHNSGAYFICKDKSKISKNDICILNKRREADFFYYTREYPYKNIKPRLIVEKFLENEGLSDLRDYKFYCFNGKAKYCQVISNRTTEETIDFFDREWILQPFTGLQLGAIHSVNSILKPENYEEMLSVADSLANAIDTPFVRIDLYNVNGNVYFSEITFYPASGMGQFFPLEWNKIIGDMIQLPIC